MLFTGRERRQCSYEVVKGMITHGSQSNRGAETPGACRAQDVALVLFLGCIESNKTEKAQDTHSDTYPTPQFCIVGIAERENLRTAPDGSRAADNLEDYS
mmetsp:Transcript_24164/g.48958  ORF Transcript_24164/g.48958 Transcript_24164/m.48958 type:complete len:100 (+) Transcript_24164:77-376(+)